MPPITNHRSPATNHRPLVRAPVRGSAITIYLRKLAEVGWEWSIARGKGVSTASSP